MEYILERVEGKPGPDWVHLKFRQQICFGRASSCEIKLLSIYVSRVHAMMKMSKTESNVLIEITDLQSINGVFVNEEKITPSVAYSLQPGDQIEFGRPLDKDLFATLNFSDRLLYKLKKITCSELVTWKRPSTVYRCEFMKAQLAQLNLCKKRKCDENDAIVNDGSIQNDEKSSHEEIDKERQKKLLEEKNKINEQKQKLEMEMEEMRKKEKLDKEERKKKEEEMKDLMKKREEEIKVKEEEMREQIRRREEEIKEQMIKTKEQNETQRKEEQDEAKEIIDNMVEVMEDQLTCPICSELFVHATTLNCSHTFCKFCIKTWTAKRKQVTCPVCRVAIRQYTTTLVLDNYVDAVVQGKLSDDMRARRLRLVQERAAATAAALEAQQQPARRTQRRRKRPRPIMSPLIDLTSDTVP